MKFGGKYLGDPKDSSDFKYVTFEELPNVSNSFSMIALSVLIVKNIVLQFSAGLHKSLMAKTLTPELFDKLKGLKTSKVLLD